MMPTMDWFSSAFLKASLVWLSLGVTLGVAMAAHPAWTVYYPAHVHMNLLGFVTMMIYGVAYHVIPRFVGRPIRRRRLAVSHWYVSNAGLVLMVVGFVIRPRFYAFATPVLAVGGTLSALGAYAFVYNMWTTLSPRPAAVAAPDRTVLPLAQRH